VCARVIAVRETTVNTQTIVNKTKKTKGKGGRPIDPDLQDKKDRLNKEYYRFTQKQGFKSSKAIEILSKKYNWKKSTIETYLK
jgi:hypothetical protein